MSAASSILYVRLPGLLTRATLNGTEQGTLPRAITEEKTVRDACPVAVRAGVRGGEPVSRSRRHCPLLLTLPLEDIDARVLAPLSNRFYDVLVEQTPTVEPAGPDAVFADLTGGPVLNVTALALAWSTLETGFAPLIGFGASRNAARACAECNLPPDRLANADARWLWPEDATVAARLFRLGLDSYGAVAQIGESSLVYQFGKLGRQLFARSVGRDFTPVRALYPPPQVRQQLRFTLEPITDEACLRHHLERLAASLSRDLRQHGHYVRRLQLNIQTERDSRDVEWILPAPVQAEAELFIALRRLRQQITIAAPVVALTAEALDLDLPAAATGSLFDNRASERKLALAATRQKLRARYGTKTLRYLRELPVPRRETRRILRQEALRP